MRSRRSAAAILLNLLGVGTLAIAAIFYVDTFGFNLPVGVDDQADPPSPRPGDLPAPASSGGDQVLVQGESGNVETPTATPPRVAKVVNGREQPAPVDPPQRGNGSYQVVAGSQRPPERSDGPVMKYIVEMERGLPFDPREFAATVHTVLNDPRSWGSGGRMQFERVDHGPVRIRVSLSSATLTDRMCSPLRTFGEVSCWDGSRAVINAERWGQGAQTYGADILSYREYVINHEVGHGLGHDHVGCPRRGALAPVMLQQTKSLEGCKPNPWPYPD